SESPSPGHKEHAHFFRTYCLEYSFVLERCQDHQCLARPPHVKEPIGCRNLPLASSVVFAGLEQMIPSAENDLKGRRYRGLGFQIVADSAVSGLTKSLIFAEAGSDELSQGWVNGIPARMARIDLLLQQIHKSSGGVLGLGRVLLRLT